VDFNLNEVKPTCHFCGRVAETMQGLSAHMRMVHGDMPKGELRQAKQKEFNRLKENGASMNARKGKRSIKCILCDKKLKGFVSLSRHMSMAHEGREDDYREWYIKTAKVYGSKEVNRRIESKKHFLFGTEYSRKPKASKNGSAGLSVSEIHSLRKAAQTLRDAGIDVGDISGKVSLPSECIDQIASMLVNVDVVVVKLSQDGTINVVDGKSYLGKVAGAANARAAKAVKKSKPKKRGKRKPPTSKYRGVSFDKNRNPNAPWRVQLSIKGRNVGLGSYPDEETAALVAMEAIELRDKGYDEKDIIRLKSKYRGS
jgi:hypothetical protein